jgi:hypothetical protein
MESQFGVSRKKRPEAFDAAEAGCPEDDDDEACIPLISLFFFLFFLKMYVPRSKFERDQ